jgi:hypothetical protein
MFPRLLLLALLVMPACTLPPPVAPSPGPFRFSGTVSRSEGNQVGLPISGAELLVINGANLNARTTTDGAGRYVFSALDSGTFTVAIAAPGYVSATPVVTLYKDLEANFALRAQ